MQDPMYTRQSNKNQVVSDVDEAGDVVVSGNCLMTGKPYSVKVRQGKLLRFNSGELVQVAFSGMSPGDREFLVTGISPEGWQQTFGEG